MIFPTVNFSPNLTLPMFSLWNFLSENVYFMYFYDFFKEVMLQNKIAQTWRFVPSVIPY